MTFRLCSCFWICPPKRWTSMYTRRNRRSDFGIPGSASAVDHSRGALRPALGEAPAPLRQPGIAPSVSFVWQGAGGSGRSSGEIREPIFNSTGGASPMEIADVVYSPLEPRPVPLTGRSGGTTAVSTARPIQGLADTPGRSRGSLPRGPACCPRADSLRAPAARAAKQEEMISQDFLEPLILELAPAESLRLTELVDELEECGFSFERDVGR